MSDKHEIPNMTATEIANAKHPDAPGQSLINWLIEREFEALLRSGYLPSFRLALDEATQRLRD